MLIAVALGVAAVAAFGLEEHGVAIVGTIPDGLPSLTIPSIGLGDVIDLLPDAVALALICFAESVAAARGLAAKHHYEVDADQELIALGVANLGAGLLQGFAVDASLSRSAVADDSGMKSQLSSIVLFGFLIVTMLFLMPLFHDLPEAVLGAIVIAAVAHLIDVGALRRLRRKDPTDFVLAILCFAGRPRVRAAHRTGDRGGAVTAGPRVSRLPAQLRRPRPGARGGRRRATALPRHRGPPRQRDVPRSRDPARRRRALLRQRALVPRHRALPGPRPDAHRCANCWCTRARCRTSTPRLRRC